MNCKNCGKELILIEGKVPKVFCDGKCTKAYSRKLAKGELTTPTSDKPTSDIAEQATKDTVNRWGEDATKMDAKTLYAFIRAYSGDSWKDSPEFKELQKRLKGKTLKQLQDEGYWIPSWKNPVRI